MKKTEKVLIIMIMTIAIVLMNICISYAAIPTDFEIDWGWATMFEKPGNSIIGTLKVVGIIMSVAMLMIIGINSMLSSANAAQKAEQKQKYFYYILGAVFVAAAPQIIDFIYKMMQI